MDWYVGKKREPLIEGREVTLAGQVFTVPPLNFKALKRVYHRMGVLGRPDDQEFVEVLGLVLHASLARNYPDMTLEMVEDAVDVRDFESVGEAIRAANNFLAQPATPTPEPTGN